MNWCLNQYVTLFVSFNGFCVDTCFIWSYNGHTCSFVPCVGMEYLFLFFHLRSVCTYLMRCVSWRQQTIGSYFLVHLVGLYSLIVEFLTIYLLVIIGTWFCYLPLNIAIAFWFTLCLYQEMLYLHIFPLWWMPFSFSVHSTYLSTNGNTGQVIANSILICLEILYSFMNALPNIVLVWQLL